MKRILFLSTVTGAPFSGSEQLWFETAMTLLRNANVSVGVCAAAWNPEPQHHRDLKGAGAALFTYERRPRGILARARTYLAAHCGLTMLEPWQRSARNYQPDLVVVSQGWWPEGAAFLQLLSSLPCPKIFLIQAASEYRWFDEAIAEKARRLFRAAAAVYFVSNANRLLVEMQLAQRLENARTAKNPVRGSLVPYPPGDLDSFRLACVGRYHVSAKGQDLLFRVLSQERWRTRPLSVRLYGSGEDERLFRRWLALFSIKSVEIMGYEPDPEKIYAACHGLILPSRHEGLPIAALEAMKCGRIVIATRVGTEEAIKEGETGFIADGPSVRCIDDALERAWSRRREWPAMGLRGAEYFAELYQGCQPARDFAAELLSFI